MLEPLVDSWEEESSVDIKMHLLTAAVKVFFKRPPEMQARLAFELEMKAQPHSGPSPSLY